MRKISQRCYMSGPLQLQQNDCRTQIGQTWGFIYIYIYIYISCFLVCRRLGNCLVVSHSFCPLPWETAHLQKQSVRWKDERRTTVCVQCILNGHTHFSLFQKASTHCHSCLMIHKAPLSCTIPHTETALYCISTSKIKGMINHLLTLMLFQTFFHGTKKEK